MNEKLKRKTLNDAFKRFQRLPILLAKGDTRESNVEKPAWQPLPFGFMGPRVPSNSTFQVLAE